MYGKIIAAFIAGGIVGGIGTYIYCRNTMEDEINEKANQLSDEAVRKTREYYRNKYAPKRNEQQEDKDADAEKEREADKKAADDIAGIKGYNKCFKGKEKDKSEKTEVEEPMQGREAIDPTNPPVLSITESQFNETNGYDKVMLTYFEQDDTVMYDMDERVMSKEDVKRYLGPVCAERFTEDEGTMLYIRNHVELEDYAISLNQEQKYVEYAAYMHDLD